MGTNLILCRSLWGEGGQLKHLVWGSRPCSSILCLSSSSPSSPSLSGPSSTWSSSSSSSAASLSSSLSSSSSPSSSTSSSSSPSSSPLLLSFFLFLLLPPSLPSCSYELALHLLQSLVLVLALVVIVIIIMTIIAGHGGGNSYHAYADKSFVTPVCDFFRVSPRTSALPSLASSSVVLVVAHRRAST